MMQSELEKMFDKASFPFFILLTYSCVLAICCSGCMLLRLRLQVGWSGWCSSSQRCENKLSFY